jgi:hypothetical protein
LLVDADRKLTEAVTAQGFQSVARQARQIFQRSHIENLQPLPTLPIKSLERTSKFALCKKRYSLVLEPQDQATKA